MYSLKLTASERAAIDWVGGRYATGDQLRSILMGCLEPDEEWSDGGELIFRLAEHKAWEINELFREEQMLFPCFSAALAGKLQRFSDQIV